MPKYRLLLNGCGGIADPWLQTLSDIENKNPGLVELAAVCDPLPASLQKLENYPISKGKNIPTYSDSSLAYKDQAIDFSIILSPPQLHTRQIQEAVDAGSHVICEKPLLVDINQYRHTRDMIQTADAKGIHLIVNQQYRWMPRIDAIRKAVADGLIGQVQFVISRLIHNRYHFKEWWRAQHEDISQVNWWIHPYDSMRAMLGANPVSVRARMMRPQWSKIYGESFIFLHVSFDSGAEWSFSAGQEGVAGFSDSGHTTLEMFGDKGTIRNIRDESPRAYIEEQPGGKIREVDLGGGFSGEGAEKYPSGWEMTFMKAIAAVESGKKHETCFDDNLWSIAIALCARESERRHGGAVDVREYLQLG